MTESELMATLAQGEAEPSTEEPKQEVDLAALQSRIAYLESDALKIQAARDKAKQKARELEAKQAEALQAKAAQLAEANEWRQAHDLLKQQLDEATPRLSRIDELETFVTQTVANARESIPEGLRESIPTSLAPMDQLKLIEALKQHTQKTTPKAPPVSPAGNQQSVDIMSMTNPQDRANALANMTKQQRAEFAKTISGKLW